MSFNSLLLALHQSEGNTTIGPELPHCSSGYRVFSPWRTDQGRDFSGAHSVACKTECSSLTNTWMTLQLHRPIHSGRAYLELDCITVPSKAPEDAQADFQEVEIKTAFLQFFIITRMFEIWGDQIFTFQGKVWNKLLIIQTINVSFLLV